MDTEVKQTVRRIFNALRKQHASKVARKSDRVDIDTMLRNHKPIDTVIRAKD